MFEGLDSLETLHVSINWISSIESGALASLKHLKHIDLGANQLHELRGDEFQGLPSLVALALNHNAITEIPAGTLAGSPKLYLLWLGSNQLTTLSEEMFKGEPDGEAQHSGHLDLRAGGNPLKCDVTMCWIKQAQKDGWLNTSPYCKNFPDQEWKDIDLGCDDRK